LANSLRAAVNLLNKKLSGWKPIHLTSVFSVRASVLSPPDGTTLTAFTDVNTDVNMDVADVR